MFNCDVCDKVFTVKSNMLRHAKSHEQIKFQCGDCKQIFNRRDHLVNHVQKKHGFIKYGPEYNLSMGIAVWRQSINVNQVIINDSKSIKRHGSPESLTPDDVTLVTKKPCTTEPEMEATSSTTPTEAPLRLTVDPAEWSVEDVIQHINCIDLQLNKFADLFRKHEIDGKALLLLKCDTMMKYMRLKLGPALKLQHLINRLKPRRKQK